MRRYFLTGCTGFIGREITRKLLELPDTESVTCLTRGFREDYLIHEKLFYCIGDIVFGNLPEGTFTDLIHGANDANDLMQPDDYKYYFTIVEGTRRILEWAKKKQIKNILVLSSGAVVRNTIYGLAKKTCEELAVGLKIARIFSVIGPEMPLNSQFAAGKFVYQALNGKIEYYGGDSTRTYLDVSDCADWIVKIMRFHGSDTYDVAGCEQIKISTLAETIGKIFAVPIEKVNESGRVDSYYPDLKKSHAIGCTQTISLEASIEKIKCSLL